MRDLIIDQEVDMYDSGEQDSARRFLVQVGSDIRGSLSICVVAVERSVIRTHRILP